MKLIFTSYSGTPEFDQPEAWLKRIDGYTGILESLAKTHEVIGIERISYDGILIRNGVKYIFTDIKRKQIHFPFKLHRMIKSTDPDIVFIIGLLFPQQLIQLRWKLGKKVKLIIIYHSERPFKGIKKYLQLVADQYIDKYLFPSKSAAKEWIQSKCISSDSKILEVMHASSVFRSSDKIQARAALKIEGMPIFLWVGRLNVNKDPLLVVNAFIELHKTHTQARLYMIFQTEELLEEINEQLSSNKAAKSAIRLIGSVPHADLQNWYNAADFLVSASYYEGGGIAIAEAMSCGCIPILTKIPSFITMTGNGKCGLLYNRGDKGQLLNQLRLACSIDIQTERQKVLEQFESHLSFSAIAAKINSVIDNKTSTVG